MRISGLIMAAFIATPVFGCGMEPEDEGQERVFHSEADQEEAASPVQDDGRQSGELRRSDDQALDGIADPVVNPSFIYSCPGWWYVTVGAAAVEAGATYCRRYDGSRRYNPSWSGWCTGNLANFDGYIAC